MEKVFSNQLPALRTEEQLIKSKILRRWIIEFYHQITGSLEEKISEESDLSSEEITRLRNHFQRLVSALSEGEITIRDFGEEIKKKKRISPQQLFLKLLPPA